MHERPTERARALLDGYATRETLEAFLTMAKGVLK